MTQDTATRSADTPIRETDGQTETVLLELARGVALQRADAAYRSWRRVAGGFSPLAPLKALAYQRAVRDYVRIEGRLDQIRPLPGLPSSDHLSGAGDVTSLMRRVGSVLSALDLQEGEPVLIGGPPADGDAGTGPAPGDHLHAAAFAPAGDEPPAAASDGPDARSDTHAATRDADTTDEAIADGRTAAFPASGGWVDIAITVTVDAPHGDAAIPPTTPEPAVMAEPDEAAAPDVWCAGPPPEPWAALTHERLQAIPLSAPAPALSGSDNPFLAAKREAAFIAAVPVQDLAGAGGGTAAEYRQAIAASLHWRRDELIRVLRVALRAVSSREALVAQTMVLRRLYDQVRYRPDRPDLGSQRYRDLRAAGWSGIPIEHLGPLTTLIEQTHRVLASDPA